MSIKCKHKKLTAAVTAALAVSGVTLSTVNAQENPFEIHTLSSGYMVAESEAKGQEAPDADVPREGSGKGCNKLGSGQCGEGTCGTNAKDDCEENLTGSKGDNSLGEGKCGEGQCGTDAVKK
ncbi:MAG: hypothetical protein ACR2PU_03950 [Gammaproteobacteria bacterium]